MAAVDVGTARQLAQMPEDTLKEAACATLKISRRGVAAANLFAIGPLLAMSMSNHQTESLLKPNRARELARGTPLSLQMAEQSSSVRSIR